MLACLRPIKEVMGRNLLFVLDRWLGRSQCDRTLPLNDVPMAQKRAHVFIPEGLLADIDQLVGKGKRSAFLTGIVEREVRRQKLIRALEEAAECWKDEDHPELKHSSVMSMSQNV